MSSKRRSVKRMSVMEMASSFNYGDLINGCICVNYE